MPTELEQRDPQTYVNRYGSSVCDADITVHGMSM